jgi:hypothetical protein
MLAERLHMTVARLRAEMTEGEYVTWTRYLSLKRQQEEIAMERMRERAGG